MTVKEGASAEMAEDLEKYFHHFAKPGEGHPCLRCGNPLSPKIIDALLGTEGGFEWGLVHGHGHCRKCRWPAVAHHFIKDRDGKDICTIHNLILQAHPDDIELRKPKTEDE
jgi:hypothetical protein